MPLFFLKRARMNLLSCARRTIALRRFCRSAHNHRTIDDREAECPHCGSPLCPANEWDLESSSQRAVNRVPKQFDIVFRTTLPQASAFSGSTVDVSPNGMRFVSENEARSGNLIKISSDIIDAVALVTHCQRIDDSNRWSIGVAFETLRLRKTQGAFVSMEA